MDFQTRYEFNPKTDLIGKGGFSKVYKATDTLLERKVALKFFTANASDKYQVLSEIKKVIRFEHPNLCKYYDVAVLSSKNILGEVEQAEVGIMEYLDAGDFKTFTKLHPEYIDKLLIDVLEGLAYLHRKGIVHRDLKPQNILVKMVDDEPVAKITDFGISKLIDGTDNNSSTLIGTIEYMAPEQFNPKKYGIGGRITTNLDLWSFGLLVYETLRQEPFFGSRSSGTSAEQVMTNILSEASLAKAEALPPKYREIVRRCIVKEAYNRVQNALELIPLFVEGTPVVKTATTEEATTSVITVPVQNEDPPEMQDDATRAIDASSLDAGMETSVIGKTEADGEAGDATSVIEPRNENEQGQTEIIHPKHTSGETESFKTQVFAVRAEEVPPKPRVVEMHGNAEHPTETISAKPEVKKLVAYPSVTGPIKQKSIVDSPFEKGKKAVLRKPVISIAVGVVLLLLLLSFLIFNRDANKKEPVIVNNANQQVDVPAAPKTAPSEPAMIRVEGGAFDMGEKNSSNESIMVHSVFLDRFEIGKFEITVEQFGQFIEHSGYTTIAEQRDSSYIFVSNEKKWKLMPNVNWRHNMFGVLVNEPAKHPVVHVSWNDAMAYCKWLSEQKNVVYRLPTEAEWEYAAKGGAKTKGFSYSGSNNLEEVGWYNKNAGGGLQPIGTKKANELGLFDMSGNVMEWCFDWFDPKYYQHSSVTNPKGPDKGKEKVLRGGSWFISDKQWLKNAYRVGLPPDMTGGHLGFRVCKEIK